MLANSLVELDRAHLVHPVSSWQGHEARGARILTSARGACVRDAEGRELIDGFAGLWCVNAGYGLWQLAFGSNKTLDATSFAAARAARLCAEGAAHEAVEAVRREMARVRLPGYAQAAALLAAGDIARRLPGLGCPLTIVVGAEDRVTPPVRVRPLADLRPGTGYVELPRVGHAGYVEDPAAYAAPVIRMIEQVR